MCDTYNCDYLKHRTFRFNLIVFQLDTDFPSQFCVFTVKSPNLHFCDKSISYQGTKIWNNIPSHVKSSENLNSFKTSFKQLIIADYNQII